MKQEREEVRNDNKKEGGSKHKIAIKVLYVMIVVNVCVGILNFRIFHYYDTLGVVKYKEIKQELTTEDFATEPTDKEFAWGAEKIPEFITKDFENAIEGEKYDGVAYTYGENKIRIEEEWPFSEYESSITVNFDLGNSLNDYSIYSNDDKIIIYGYWNDEFRKITVGKTEEDVTVELITSNPEIPIDAKALATGKIADEVILVLSQDNYTVSAYKEQSQIGEEFVFSEKISGIYNEMLLTESNNLYMPYVLNDDGKQTFSCVKIASISEEELDTAIWRNDTSVYSVRYFASVGGMSFPVFRENNQIRMLVPNELEKYIEYKRGEAILTSEDDLQWHWIEIK